MKVYNGWVLNINGSEWTVSGSHKLRGVQSYILTGEDGEKATITRDILIDGMSSGDIFYVTSVSPR